MTASIERAKESLSVMSLALCTVRMLVVFALTFTAFAASAQAAPSLDVTLSHSPTTMPRSDEFLTYTATVSNDAGTSVGVGNVLTCNGIETEPNLPKNWNPGSPGGVGFPTFSFEWVRNGVVIPTATSQTYTLTAADQGAVVQCLVKGTNSTAAAKYPSLPGTVPDPAPAVAPPAPDSPTLAASRPAISVSGADRICSTSAMNWTGNPTYAFQWLRNGEAIPGATNATYTPTALDNNTQLQCRVVGANAGGSLVGISNHSIVGSLTGNPNLPVAQTPAITSDLDNVTSGAVTLTVDLPAGGLGTRAYSASGPGWACVREAPTSMLPGKVTCTRSDALAAKTSYPPVTIGMSVAPEMSDPAIATATAAGGGSAGASAQDSFSFSGPALPFGITPNTFLARALDAAGSDYTTAGGHPDSATVSFRLNTHRDPAGGYVANGYVRSVLTDPPTGFVANPRAIPARCKSATAILSDSNPAAPTCPKASVVGGVDIGLPGDSNLPDGVGFTNLPLYALPPERGAPAQFMFAIKFSNAIYALTPKLRPEDGYSIRVVSTDVVKAPVLAGASVTLCSYGAELTGADAVDFVGCKDASDPDAFAEPFLTNPPVCTSTPPTTRLHVDSWEHPGVFDSAESVAPPTTECDSVPFTPSVSVTPTSDQRDSASGLEADISVPDSGLLDPDGVAQAHLKKTVVELPEGVTVNPSGATGLAGCSDAQLGLGTNDEPTCPDGSKIGMVEATTPLLEEELSGALVLRTPKSTDPMSGEMLRMALIIRNDERGILVKLPGSATADPQTGRLTATFDENPQLPIGNVKVELKSGSRGVLAMPQDCGQVETRATLTPWNELTESATSDTLFDVGGDCALGFAPKVDAGMSNSDARESGDFSFTFSRQDGEQWVDGLKATLPAGLLAKVRDVPLCSGADAEAGTCPDSSRIGTVDAAAGSGTPFVLERKGDAYLTEGYKGCAYGLVVKVPVVAGPFDGSSPETDLGDVIVRQSVCVDRSTAQVTATSDPLPTIWHGIPLRVRSVTVKVDRDGFMLNPSDCDEKQVRATLHSERGASADASSRFEASGCAALPFRPKLVLRLIGKRQVTTGTHPRVKAIVTQRGIGEAGIEKTVVRLPKSLALDPNNAQALCEFADGTKPDLENHCPAGSIVGRARAKTPLLKDDLVGNVYFVKNVRRDPTTGNLIRTLPMLIVALRGEIAVNLKGESSTTSGGKLVNTFANVPDAPVSQFNLNVKGGPNGILAVTQTRRGKINLCASRQIAEVDNDGQNGRRHDVDVRIKTPCTQRQTEAAKRAAAKARAGSKRG